MNRITSFLHPASRPWLACRNLPTTTGSRSRPTCPFRCRFLAGIVLWIPACLLVTAPGRAATIYDLLTPPPEHRLWLEYNQGLENSQSFYGELDLAIAGAHHLLLGAGQSDIQGRTRRVDLYSYTLGVNTPYGDPFEAGLRYEFWGNTSELWTHSLSLPLGWNTADWFLGVQPGYTTIGFTIRRPNRPVRQHDTASQFIELHLGYFGFDAWQLRLYGAGYHYDEDLSRLQNPLANYLLSDVTIVLGYGFPRYRLGGELAHDFGRISLGGTYERTIVESDGSRLDIVSLKAALPAGERLVLHLQGGRVSGDTTPAYNYLRLAGDVAF